MDVYIHYYMLLRTRYHTIEQVSAIVGVQATGDRILRKRLQVFTTDALLN